jgi:serine/threonine protein kinase
MGYVLEERIASSGREAEIFRVRQGEGQYVLKLYHYNVAPKKEILDKMREISEQFPECVVRIYGCGQDPASERWYELQECVRNGSLRDIMPGLLQSLSENPDAAIVGRIVREIADALIVLHASDIMHCDLKPANILVRSMEPLDLVLTDFGVSSMLDPEASSRATGIKGSPMYQAPEAFAGHVTRSLDWWALGCITFEILLGRHPFSGLNSNEIMLKLVQSGIDLSGLDFSSPPLKSFELLLKGLLTRDYQKRWGGKEVRSWLDGNRNIPVHYLQTQQTEKLTPYRARKRAYYEIRELLASFTENEEAWKRGLEALYRGELEIWLTGNGQEEDKRKVTEVKNRHIDKKNLQNAGLFELIYAYNPQLPFCFCGMKINVVNLSLLCGKQVKKEPLTQAEVGVAKAISDETLSRLYQRYTEVTQTRDDELEAVFELLKNAESTEKQWGWLQAVFIAPGKYYWPPFAGDLINSQPRDRLDFIMHRFVPMVFSLTELQNRVMPIELAMKMQNPVYYDEFLTEIERLLSRPNTGQADDAQPMAFSNCDGSQFTVRIVQKLPSPSKSKSSRAEDAGRFSSGDVGTHRYSQESSSTYDETTTSHKERPVWIRRVLSYFGTAFVFLIVPIVLFALIAAGQIGIIILCCFLLGAGTGSIISVIRRIKKRPGFVLGILCCLGAAVVMVSLMLPPPETPPVVPFLLVYMGAGIIFIISVIRRILARIAQWRE